jgi:hypothetical protein
MTKVHKTVSSFLALRKESKFTNMQEFLNHSKGVIDLQVVQENFVELTVDGRPLVSGEFVFKLMDTHGVPLEILIDTIYDRGMSVKWEEWILTALAHKWLVYQIMKRIEGSLRESFYFAKNEDAIQSMLFSARVVICQNVPQFNKYLIYKDKQS